MKDHKVELRGKKVCISGSGNVATHAAEKCIELGARVLTLSDSNGTIYEVNITLTNSIYKTSIYKTTYLMMYIFSFV